MDMIVANSGSNQVLVYLGIKGSNGKATGQFAPPMAFFAGTDPVDVQVADVAGFHVDAKTGKLVTGDGIMDLVVTNAGSNDLSIFKGTGDASLLDPKPLVIGTGGSDPVSTQVGDFNSDQIPDLLVTNHDSNNVTMLSGSGFGFFSPTPTVYNTGRGPTETLVGNFDSRPGLDFATLNFFSNSLTFYSGFNVGSRTDMSSGGTNPATAIAADFNNDGTLDLVVGNNGNGVFSVFEGSQAGLSLMNSFSDPSIDHPAALALAEFGQGQELQLLALGEGDELVHEFGRDTIVGPQQQRQQHAVGQSFRIRHFHNQLALRWHFDRIKRICIARGGAGNFGRRIFHAKLHDQLFRRERHCSQPAAFVGDYRSSRFGDHYGHVVARIDGAGIRLNPRAGRRRQSDYANGGRRCFASLPTSAATCFAVIDSQHYWQNECQAVGRAVGHRSGDGKLRRRSLDRRRQFGSGTGRWVVAR